MNNKSPISHFRGKYFCAQKQIFANFQQRQLEYGTNYRTITDTYHDPDTNLQEFPGYLDRGSPLIIVEGIGEDRRLIVIGIFQEQCMQMTKDQCCFLDLITRLLIGLFKMQTLLMIAPVSPSHLACAGLLGNPPSIFRGHLGNTMS